MHAARIDCKIAGSHGESAYRVRLHAGQKLRATLDAGVAPALAEECLREGRTMIVVDSPGGPTIIGALQVAPTLGPDARGTLVLDATHLRLRAARSVAIEVPGASLQLDDAGSARLEGDRLVIDMAAVVRIFSARVEVP